MCKRVRMLFGLVLVIMLTACNAKGDDSADNELLADVQTAELTEVPTELPTTNPTDETTEVPTELPTPKPTVSQTATPILTPEVEVEQTPRPKGDIPERSYESHGDFPYENMDFVDDTTYAFLKKTYDEIDFYGEFQTGDLSVYDEYIEAYRKLLNNESLFVIQDSWILPEIGESYYMKDYSTIQGSDKYDPSEFTYYLFDMDGDGSPELCIWNDSTYIFKYDAQTKEMILWMSIGSPYERVHGTQKLRWDWEGVRHTLCRVNENGEIAFGVYFMEEAFWSNGKVAFMVTVPTYEDREIEITMDMKKQAYFNEEDGLYYFNVTEEQYDELTKDYFRAKKQAEEELEKITYTYEELFQNQTGAAISKELDVPLEEKAETNNEIQNIYNQIMEGDLTALSQMEYFERIESVYNNPNTLGDYEWKLVDIDHNGCEELVWQEKEDIGYMKRIVGLFSFEKEPKCIILDLNDCTEFYFISDNGNLVYYDQYLGMYRFFSLDGYTLDENLNLDFTYGLCLYDIYDLKEIDEKYLLEFQEYNPDVVSEGIYYRKIVPQKKEGVSAKEVLTEEQFVNEFTELMGIDFYEYYEEFS